MRQPNYHSHWREWMHSRHWIMNAQFQGIHSLNACCWVPRQHVRFFICTVANLFYNHCNDIFTSKYLQICEIYINKCKMHLHRCRIIFSFSCWNWGVEGCWLYFRLSCIWLLCPFYCPPSPMTLQMWGSLQSEAQHKLRSSDFNYIGEDFFFKLFICLFVYSGSSHHAVSIPMKTDILIQAGVKASFCFQKWFPGSIRWLEFNIVAL